MNIFTNIQDTGANYLLNITILLMAKKIPYYLLALPHSNSRILRLVHTNETQIIVKNVPRNGLGVGGLRFYDIMIVDRGRNYRHVSGSY